MVLTLMPILAAAGEGFHMQVTDTFTISDGKVIVTGKVAGGTVATGEVVCLVRADGRDSMELTVAGIERFRKVLESASEGDFVGILLAGINKGDVAKGDTLTAAC
jgi:elongation factor Tu